MGTPILGWATHYGESYQGLPLGCGPFWRYARELGLNPTFSREQHGVGNGVWDGVYRTDDPTIAAVSPDRYAEWPCGTKLLVCGPAGCAPVMRVDSCPGCSANVIDLSESANHLVCGVPEHTCRVTIEVIR